MISKISIQAVSRGRSMLYLTADSKHMAMLGSVIAVETEQSGGLISCNMRHLSALSESHVQHKLY